MAAATADRDSFMLSGMRRRAKVVACGGALRYRSRLQVARVRSVRTRRVLALTSFPPLALAALALIAPACKSTVAKSRPQAKDDGRSSRRRPCSVRPMPTARRTLRSALANVDDYWDPIPDPIPFTIVTATSRTITGSAARAASSTGTPRARTRTSWRPDAVDGHRDLKVRQAEIFGGFHRTFLRSSAIRPFFGFGVSLAYTYENAQRTIVKINAGGNRYTYSNTEHDNLMTFGLYAHGGIEWQVSENVQFGVDVRGLKGTDIGFFSPTTNIDAVQAAIFIGFGG
jgi:hypothetical protein